MKIHPLAELLPDFTEERFRELVEKIKQHGLKHPIVLYEGKILDGRHRFKACEIAGIEPRFVEWDETMCGSPLEFIFVENAARRDMTPSQRSCFAVAFKKQFEEDNKNNKKEGGKKGGATAGRGRNRVQEKIPEPYESAPKDQSRDSAAKILGVNPRYIDKAESLQKNAPDLFDKCVSGEMNIPTATKLATLPTSHRKEIHAKVEAGETTYKDAAKYLTGPDVKPIVKHESIQHEEFDAEPLEENHLEPIFDEIKSLIKRVEREYPEAIDLLVSLLKSKAEQLERVAV